MAIREDVHRLGFAWHPTLEWYAKAVRELKSRTINKRTSWTYLAAIHALDLSGWRARGIIGASDPLPPAGERRRIWTQCQHSNWFFLPWHRGYLAAFEAIIAKTIVDLGGPADWALPYWNYLDTTNSAARTMPRAFTDLRMPDGTPNPLRAPRSAITLGPKPWLPSDINLSAMSQRWFTAAPSATGFGGGVTGFSHSGGAAGTVERNPHNSVHVMIGGGTVSDFMGDPRYAALDPIFWLHHCNIDRLWAAWMTKASSIPESGAAWTGGPTPRQFELPTDTGGLKVFTPDDTVFGGSLEPTYDDLVRGTGVPAAPVGGGGGGGMPAGVSPSPPAATPMGSNGSVVTVKTSAETTITLAPAETITASPSEEHVYLNLENIRGTAPSGALNVYVSLPAAGTMPASAPELVETVPLFGLASATADEGPHGGAGISVAIDITDLVNSLRGATDSDLDRLEVRVEQPLGEARPAITVERISVYRQSIE